MESTNKFLKYQHKIQNLQKSIQNGAGLKTHIVLVESKTHGWIAYATQTSNAKSLIKIHDDLFYVFKCSLAHYEPVLMKLKYPLKKYYMSTSINIYKEESYDKSEEGDKKYLYVMNLSDKPKEYFNFDVEIKA